MEEDVLILLGVAFNLNLPLLTAWLLDHWLGDPAWLPHPVVAFGKAISFCEHRVEPGRFAFSERCVCGGGLLSWGYMSVTLLLLRLAALFLGHASDGANIADILLLGGHYAGSRGAYGVQGGGPFLGGREDASGTYR